MANTNRTVRSETSLVGIVWSMALMMLFLLLLAIPLENIRTVVETEWQQSTEVFGNWAVGLTRQIYDFFGVEHLMHED